MEDWQKNHIIKNLPKLMYVTEFNCNVQTELLANNVIGKADVEHLVGE